MTMGFPSKSLAIMPPLYLLLSFFTFGVMLHTHRQSRRILGMPFFLYFAVGSLTSAKHFWFLPSLMGLWTQSVTLYVLHVISVLFIERWPSPSHALAKSPSDSARLSQMPAKGWMWKLRTTYRLWGNPRLHRIEHYVSKTTEQTRLDAGIDRQLYAFLFLRAIKLPIYYYLHIHVLPELFAETVVDIMPSDVGPNEQMLFRRLAHLTAREAVVRAYVSIIWIWESFVLLDGANAILSILLVLAGLDEPDDWPTLFGGMKNATSLRKFWGQFWHVLATRPYSNYGRLVARRVVKLESGSRSFNTIVALTVFALSGVTHAVTAWQFGYKDWRLEICWFLLNFLGCSVEKSLLSFVREFAKRADLSQELEEIENSWFGYLVGYTWVFGFFFWSVPKWKYPRMRQDAVFRHRHREFLTKLQSFHDS